MTAIDTRALEIISEVQDELAGIAAPEVLEAMKLKAVAVRCASLERQLKIEKDIGMNERYEIRRRV